MGSGRSCPYLAYEYTRSGEGEAPRRFLDGYTGYPQTELATAVGYALNQWEAFVRYCDHGWLLIDNTRSERALRPIAVGRNNWLFGSDRGGRTGAILSSLVCSAKANRVHPHFYLEDIYRRLPKIRQHESLLPVLRDACGQVELPGGARPRLELLDSPLDYLRILRPSIRPGRSSGFGQAK